jgi:hypothetical protein
MMNEENENRCFQNEVQELLSSATGHDTWCRVRRRTTALIERELFDREGSFEGYEDIGSSDVSGRVYELWLDRKRTTGQSGIDDGLVFEINGLVNSL